MTDNQYQVLIYFVNLLTACPPGFVLFKQTCYWPVDKKIQLSDSEQQETCGRNRWLQPATLASIHSIDEAKIIERYGYG